MHVSSGLSRRARAAAMIALALASVGVAGADGLAHAEPRPIHHDVFAVDSSPRPGVAAERTNPPDRAASTQAISACPIDGPSRFEDSFGWARSGGRRHQGVDMIAERGTPVVAVADGVLTESSSRLGGISWWLETDTGDRFFYAHLDAREGSARTVRAGDVIGSVGSTGNARGPHLHLEAHLGGDVVNPYLHVVRACVPPLGPSSDDRP